MRREISAFRALLNIALAAAVVCFGVWGLQRVARRQWKTQAMFVARAEFSHIAGIRVGDRALRVQGMEAGVVDAIAPPSEPGRAITLVLRLDDRLRPLIRSDAVARISVEGVVGSKLVEIVPGKPDAPPLADGAALRSERPVEVADLLRDAQASLHRLDAMTARAEKGVGEIQAIAAKVQRGEGTLGRLTNDDELYRDLQDLSFRGRKAFHELDENLTALKRTWPLKSYFENRAYYDVDRVLYRPGAERASQVLQESDLFEPGAALLSAKGKHRLDGIAAWFQAKPRSKNTEVVIAAFTDSAPRGEDVARILTQDQANAVRNYLVAHHSINSVGWFNSRKVAAVGFGTRSPRSDDETVNRSPRRVEVVLFSPQA